MSARDIVVVSGAASGVGAATVTTLHEAGAAIVAVDLESVPEADGLRAVVGDVCDPDTWTRAVLAAEQLGGAPTKLVINAARLIVGTVTELSVEDLRSVLDVNVIGAFHALAAVIPAMVSGGGGSIVAVASTDALVAEQRLAAYCASKGALLQLIRCVAVDYARHGIRANCVCPGAIDTPFFRRHVEAAADPEAFLREKEERHPSGRILQAEEVARTIAFLLSDHASGITGSAVTVDGGLLASFDFNAA